MAVRLPDDLLEQLQKKAKAENKKVSDIVKELIVSGLVNKGNDQSSITNVLAEQMGRLEEHILAALQPAKDKTPPRILQAAEELKQVKEQLAALERLTKKTAISAAKAQFLASMSVGFCADSARLIGGGTIPEKGEKEAFLEQTNEWAEGFAENYLKD